MKKNFGFKILDEEALVDKKGLLKYLANIIFKEFCCIYCDHQLKSARAAQKHMIDKEHCQMNEDFFEQYEQFYDFSKENEKFLKRLEKRYKNSSDPETLRQIELIKKSINKNGAIDNNEEENSDDWEDVSDDEPQMEEILKNEQKEENEEKTPAPQTKKISKEFADLRKQQITHTGELKLLNGKLAGHRDYLLYYNQNLKIEDEEKKRVKQLCHDRQMQRKLLCLQQAMIMKGKGDSRVNQVMLKHYNFYLNRMKMQRDRVNRGKLRDNKKKWMKLGVQHNKLMPHFRDRNMIYS